MGNIIYWLMNSYFCCQSRNAVDDVSTALSFVLMGATFYPIGSCAALAATQPGIKPMRLLKPSPVSRVPRLLASLLAGLGALLLAGCGPDTPAPASSPTEAQQEAGAPSSVVQANARQYRDAPAPAWATGVARTRTPLSSSHRLETRGR